MLFYAIIVVACLFTAVVISRLYRLVSGVAGSFRVTAGERSKNLPAAHLNSQAAATINSGAWTRRVDTLAAMPMETGQNTGRSRSYFGTRERYAPPLEAKVRLKSSEWLNREDRQTGNQSSYKIRRRSQDELNRVSKPKIWA